MIYIVLARLGGGKAGFIRSVDVVGWERFVCVAGFFLL